MTVLNGLVGALVGSSLTTCYLVWRGKANKGAAIALGLWAVSVIVCRLVKL